MIFRAPGPRGLFVVLTGTGTQSRAFYAFRLVNKTVESGIQANTSGRVTGEEGIRLRKRDVLVRNPDTAHLGAVRYRTVVRLALTGASYHAQPATVEPDYPTDRYPAPNGVVHASNGDIDLILLHVAATEEQRETGLMNQTSLDPDAGMLFTWESPPVLESFWMENTLIPLSVAFLGASGTIQEVQDMTPMTTTLHTPAQPYWYALEVHAGYFTSHGIRAGDRIDLHLVSTSLRSMGAERTRS